MVPPPSHPALPLHRCRNAPCLAFGQGAAAAPAPLPAAEPLDLPNLRPASAEGSRGQASTPHNRRPSSSGAGASLLSPPLHLVLQSPAPRPPVGGSGGDLLVLAYFPPCKRERKEHGWTSRCTLQLASCLLASDALQSAAPTLTQVAAATAAAYSVHAVVPPACAVPGRRCRGSTTPLPRCTACCLPMA